MPRLARTRLWPRTCGLVLALSLLGSGPDARADGYVRIGPEGVPEYTNVQPKGRGWRRIFSESRKSRVIATPPARR